MMNLCNFLNVTIEPSANILGSHSYTMRSSFILGQRILIGKPNSYTNSLYFLKKPYGHQNKVNLESDHVFNQPSK